LQQIAEKPAVRGRIAPTRLVVAGFAAALVACDSALEPVATASLEPSPDLSCVAAGRLETVLFGAFTGALDWSAADLECTGMPRPNGEGGRLRFAGAVEESDRRIAIIIGIPGLRRGTADRELNSNVTLLEEGSGMFFSTSSLGSCWTDVTAQDRLDGSTDKYVITGTVYCVSPLAEVNGDSSLSIPELGFTGLLDWSAK